MDIEDLTGDDDRPQLRFETWIKPSNFNTTDTELFLLIEVNHQYDPLEVIPGVRCPFTARSVESLRVRGRRDGADLTGVAGERRG